MGKKIPMWQVAIVMAFTILALMYAMDILAMIFKSDALACGYGGLHVPLIASASVAAIVAVLNSYKWSFLEAGILASINRSMQAMLILMCVGLLIGSWIAGGVVPAMIYYGLMIPNHPSSCWQDVCALLYRFPGNRFIMDHSGNSKA